jgi:2-haloacid dehalogenase
MVIDVGGARLDWDPRHLYHNRIPDPLEMEWFLANVCTSQWHDPHDRGASTAQSCTVLDRRWPTYAGLIWAWWERGEEMAAGPLDDGVALFRQVVDSGLACYALTNMEAETYPKRRRRYEFLSWFVGMVVSGFEGVAKPDPQFYEVLLARFDLDPETTLFIDDGAVNVAAAADVGRVAYLYTGPAPVLARLGLVRG